MDLGAVALLLLGGGGIGAWFVTVYQKREERAERQRDRMLDAADRFLVAVDSARNACKQVFEAESLFLDRKKEMDEAVEAFPKEDVDLPDDLASTLQELVLQMRRLFGAVHADALPVQRDEESAAIEKRADELESDLREHRDGPHKDFVRAATNFAFAVRRSSRAQRQFIDAGTQATTSLNDAIAAMPRLVILFGTPAGNEEPVIKNAFAAIEAIADGMHAFYLAQGDDKEKKRKAAQERIGESIKAIRAFSDDVNAHFALRPFLEGPRHSLTRLVGGDPGRKT